MQTFSVSDLLQKVKEGMIAACHEPFWLTDNPLEKIAAEYLLTVNIAKLIGSLNTSFGLPYIVRLECSTRKFATECFPLFEQKSPKNVRDTSRKIRGRFNAQRNGRIDVAVFCNGINERSICAIELKGFNPSRTVVVKDLKRNAEYFGLSCPTGESSLLFTAFGALVSVEDQSAIYDKSGNLRRIEEKYTQWMSEIGAISNFHASVVAFSISHQAEHPGIDDDTGAPDDAEEYNHHHIGVLVVFLPKAQDISSVRAHLGQCRV